MATYVVAEEEQQSGPVQRVSEVSIGIDMGTSTLRSAVWSDGSVNVFSGADGRQSLPANVLYNEAGYHERVGTATNDQLWSGSAMFNIKRIIGRMDVDPIVHLTMESSPYLVDGLDIGIKPFVGALGRDGFKPVWRSVTPEEVLAVQLREIRNTAEMQLGRMVRTAVVTVPVCFSRFQLTRIERACGMAGLQVARLMPEPTAVALLHAQVTYASNASEKLALIFNMGHGYTDAAVTATEGGVCQIRALAGDTFGGEELLINLVGYLASDMLRLLGENVAKDKLLLALGRLRFAAQRAMEQLSSKDEALIEVNLDGDKTFTRSVTRGVFMELNAGYLQKCSNLVMGCLKDADVEPETISDVVAVGGCSYIPGVRTALLRVFGESKEIFKGIDQLEAAVRGAALEGAITSGLTDPSGSLELLTIQAMPLSVGLGIAGGEFLVMLRKNSAIPARRDVALTTCHDEQKDALVVVYEGESRLARENHLLGFFKLSGIPSAPKGVPIISICFDVDASNVLRVIAGAFVPNSPVAPVPLREVKMPTVDDGHGWCLEAIFKQHGNNMDVTPTVLPPQEPMSS